MEEDGLEKLLFPARRLFGSMKQEYLVELQGKLSAYLSSVLQCFTLPPQVLLDFLEYKYNVSSQCEGAGEERENEKQRLCHGYTCSLVLTRNGIQLKLL